VPDGAKNVKVGKVIALLAQEGDDISNLEAPPEKAAPPKKEAASPPPQAASVPATSVEAKAAPPAESKKSQSSSSKHPKHPRPLFPSVSRLIAEKGISNPNKIKGTGVRGMLTKGDVLAHLGLASGPTGTFKEITQTQQTAAPAPAKEVKVRNISSQHLLNF
jgi:pyruvate/2-oxoglutarate dehydrogenase complex dihydrolipoamide acyltransferase (E2) component